MPTSVRLDDDTEALLVRTAKALNTTKTTVLKASIREYCTRTLKERSESPYDLISDLIGTECSHQGNLSMDGEEILRKTFAKKK